MIVLTRTRRIDWPRVVSNLQRSGMSLQQIADRIDVSKSLVAGWADPEMTGEPAFWTGSALIELWCEQTGLTWPELPVHVVNDIRFMAVRSSATESERITQSLLQLSFAWNTPATAESEAQSLPAGTNDRVCYRVALAYDQGSLRAVVFHDRHLAACAEKSPAFVRWDGPWIEAAVIAAQAAATA